MALPVGDALADGAGLAEPVGSGEGFGDGLLLAGGPGLGDGHRIGTGMTQPGWLAAAGCAALGRLAGQYQTGQDEQHDREGELAAHGIHRASWSAPGAPAPSRGA